jgi:endo-1,4-beta-D-glucanase Y
MAFALAMADRQWNTQGALSMTYKEYAVQQIKNVYKNDILAPSNGGGPGILAGDGWGKDWTKVNISYFAPSYYRVFANLDSADDWTDAVKTTYDTIGSALAAANGNATNGLVPAWCNSQGATCMPEDVGIVNDNGYQYDACRTPFRVGVDWCWNSEARAQAYVAKTSAFFSAVGVQNIADTYALDGAPMPQHPGGHSAAFIGPAGVGAMSSGTYGSFVDNAYASVATMADLAGGQYYEESWSVLSLLMMTGNFLDYTQLTPAQ